MLRLLGLATLCAGLVFATPVLFTGHGVISGSDGSFDLAGDGFNWHVSTDSTQFMGQVCELDQPCDLGLFFTADSLSDVTSVVGQWGGRNWGLDTQRVVTSSDTFATWRFPPGVVPGTRIEVPLAINGTIDSLGLHLVFAGAGAQWVTVMSVDNGTAGVVFGAFDLFGGIASTDDSVPEPATFALILGGLLVFTVLRRAARGNLDV